MLKVPLALIFWCKKDCTKYLFRSQSRISRENCAVATIVLTPLKKDYSVVGLQSITGYVSTHHIFYISYHIKELAGG